ncbi:hypothetical protein OAK35_02435 [Crocinitomicaceae bacterium]|nr:hypothetical protein [Crocinitomicaceae bacterium]
MASCSASSSDNDNPESTEKESIESTAEFPEKITFPSLDGLAVTANLYEIASDNPVIVLCHQARFNKAEYHGIAERLNTLGFSCMAIDQRSGGPVVEYQNDTNLAAVKAGKEVDFLDAEQDIRAAVKFASEKYKRKVILWGSSYSSSLVPFVAADMDEVSAFVSFSPGDYYQPEKESLVTILKDFEKPMFLTSSKREAVELSKLVQEIGLNQNEVQFIPESAGHHGSRALWVNQDGGEEYWQAITAFLNERK